MTSPSSSVNRCLDSNARRSPDRSAGESVVTSDSDTHDVLTMFSIPSSVPRSVCQPVQRQQCEQVPEEVCSQEPRQQCRPVQRQVQRQECSQVPSQQCRYGIMQL